MGRWSTYPTHVEDCQILSITDLRKYGYLNCNKSGVISFLDRHGEVLSSFRIQSNMSAFEPYIQFRYVFTSTQQDINYKVSLKKVSTNIGNGFRYYFVCPHTNKTCMKLYRPPHEIYYFHRSAFPYLIYRAQTQSGWSRNMGKILNADAELSKLKDELIFERPKYRKTYYKGKPTKKLQRLIELQDKMDNRLGSQFISLMN